MKLPLHILMLNAGIKISSRNRDVHYTLLIEPTTIRCNEVSWRSLRWSENDLW